IRDRNVTGVQTCALPIYESREPRVEEDHVAAAAQDVCGQAALGRVCQRRADLVLGAALDEIAGFPSEPECGVRGEGHVFAQLHDSSSTLASSVAAPRRGHAVARGLHEMYALAYLS